jgi:hypothetical protein
LHRLRLRVECRPQRREEHPHAGPERVIRPINPAPPPCNLLQGMGGGAPPPALRRPGLRLLPPPTTHCQTEAEVRWQQRCKSRECFALQQSGKHPDESQEVV